MTTRSIDTVEMSSEMSNSKTFARYFDHTNLKPWSGWKDIDTLCTQAAQYGFATVCVAPRWVESASAALVDAKPHEVKVCTVVGFPLGYATSETKAFETRNAIDHGAREIDMVISIGDLIDDRQDAVERDIAAVVDAAQSEECLVKVILETHHLTDDQIELGCVLAMRAGADYVKTSTGFAPSGARPEIVRLMRKTVGDSIGVKAAHGIATLAHARAMLDAGASRLGCSSSVSIVQEFCQSG